MNFERLSRISRQTTVRDPLNKLQDIIHRMFCEKFNKNNDLLKLCPNIQQLEGRLSGATTRPVDGCLVWTIKNPQSQ
jgi:predicted ATPase